MERRSTRDEVRELDLIISGYIPDHMPDNFWKAYERLKQLAFQAGWPEEIHQEYLKALDERDELQWRLEGLEK